MLSKCANPECSESFRYLHEGRIFHLAPTPEVRITMGKFHRRSTSDSGCVPDVRGR